MKIQIINISTLFITAFLSVSCNEKSGLTFNSETSISASQDENEITIQLTNEQFKTLDMKLGKLPLRILSDLVEANGQLEVPPQNEALVTAIIGANISSIEVIEGDDIRKGQVLAYLSHPDLIKIQSDYLEAFNQLIFLEEDFRREKKLYDEEVGSGKNFQQTRADYNSTQAKVKSYESQLRQLGMNPSVIQKGELYEQVPVISPISGTITMVGVKTGQYVQSDRTLFEIVDVHHVHADLMIFEKDVHKVQEGQHLRFTVETLPETELLAEIYSVGKKFETKPKAVHVHAEIENKSGKLIPGMYIKGHIITNKKESQALPEEAITRDGDTFVAFVLVNDQEKKKKEWIFKPVNLKTGISDDGWTEVKFLQDVPEDAIFALNNSYYLIAEMKKGEGGHAH